MIVTITEKDYKDLVRIKRDYEKIKLSIKSLLANIDKLYKAKPQIYSNISTEIIEKLEELLK